jgi:nicotinamidase-related amidase
MRIISVDFQRDFVSEGGRHFQNQPCIPFVQNVFIPFVRLHGYRIAEIISDYRLTPPHTGVSVCVPGEWGYQSEIPSDIKMASVWVKAETSPSWVRSGGGNPACDPGEPYPDPNAFSAWLAATIGPPDRDNPVLLIGLALEICVLCTMQELKLRGYEVRILFEGVDTYTGDLQQKENFLETLFPFWGQAIRWEDLQQQVSIATQTLI